MKYLNLLCFLTFFTIFKQPSLIAITDKNLICMDLRPRKYKPETRRKASSQVPLDAESKKLIYDIVKKNPEYPELFTQEDFKKLNKNVIKYTVRQSDNRRGEDVIAKEILPIIEFLIYLNKFDSRSEHLGVNLLNWTAKRNLPIALFLIKNNLFDINAKDDYGNTALILASSSGYIDVVKSLLRAQADLNITNNTGSTALIVASNFGHSDIVKLLINNNADLNITTPNGNTALIVASNSGRFDIVKLLINNNADLNIKNKYGNTALMYAIDQKRNETARLLILAGANPNIRNKKGETALTLANKNGLVDTVNLLKSHGAKESYMDLVWKKLGY